MLVIPATTQAKSHIKERKQAQVLELAFRESTVRALYPFIEDLLCLFFSLTVSKISECPIWFDPFCIKSHADPIPSIYVKPGGHFPTTLGWNNIRGILAQDICKGMFLPGYNLLKVCKIISF
jgi:hypothetical protein